MFVYNFLGLFLKLVPLHSLPGTFQFPEDILFCPPARKSLLLQLCLSLDKHWEDRLKKAKEFVSTFLEPQLHQRVVRFSFLSFGSYRHPMQTNVITIWVVRKEKKRKGQKTVDNSKSLSFSPFHTHLKPDLEGFWISFCLYHGTQIQVLGYTEVRSEYSGGLVVFQSLTFFCNVSAAICAGFTVFFTPYYPTRRYYPFLNK